jgi:DNA-binding transcriptional ArsR family regulator
MNLLKESLGKEISVRELSQILGLNEKTIRSHYDELGGIKIGRRIKFYENEVLYAIQKRKEDIRTSTKEWSEERESVQNNEGCEGLGSRNEKAVRRRMERDDEHGLLV